MRRSLILVFLALASCQFNKSVNKDLVTGLATRGDGLSADEVYLTDGEARLARNTFSYGELFYVYFEDLDGFETVDGKTKPGMSITVKDTDGSVVIQKEDVYEDDEGTDQEPLLLQANLTVADPIHSNKKYILEISIWDKLGEGTFNASLPFSVKPSELITVINEGLRFDEVYLYSQKTEAVILDNAVSWGETVHVVVEGLTGFIEKDGQLNLGASITAVDSEGEYLVNTEDLLLDTAITVEQLNENLAPSVVFSQGELSNPVTCKVVIWDKWGPRKFSVETQLAVN